MVQTRKTEADAREQMGGQDTGRRSEPWGLGHGSARDQLCDFIFRIPVLSGYTRQIVTQAGYQNQPSPGPAISPSPIISCFPEAISFTSLNCFHYIHYYEPALWKIKI